MSLEYKQVLKREEFGGLGSFGMEILISTDHEITHEENIAIMRAYDAIREAVGIVSVALNQQEVEARNKEQQNFVGMFPPDCLWRAIPNQYCSRWCCSQQPWYMFATPIGPVTIGWRKGVINIDWSISLLKKTAEELFPGENTTKGPHSIHAWGQENARRYVDVLLREAKKCD